MAETSHQVPGYQAMDQTTSRPPDAAGSRVVSPPRDEECDVVLVELLQQGDPRAPRILIERYSDLVFGMAFGMLRHRQDAEDVAQETFLRALRAIAGFDSTRPLRPWLLSIAANRCRTALQQRVRRPALSEGLEAQPDRERPSGPHSELLEELSQALDRLRPEYRLVFVLFHEQNLPYEEIGQALDRPVGTVKTWLHRARAELARHLASRGFKQIS
jgi:RNA polymerase sigma-70 factor (ECF subfamily)